MNRTSIAMVIPLVLLATLATTPIMIIEDAFARPTEARKPNNISLPI